MFEKKKGEDLLIGIIVLVLIASVAMNATVNDLVLNLMGYGILDRDCSVDLDNNGIGDACDSDLVLWMEMEDDMNAVDSSKYGNDGVVYMAENVEGVIGNGFMCAYPGDIEIPHNKHFNFKRRSFSISVWIKYGGDKVGHIVKKYDAYNKGWTLSHDTSKGIYAFLGDVDAFYGSKKEMNYEGWQHLVSVYDGDLKMVRFYLDGVLVSQKDISKDLNPTANFDTSEPIILCDGMKFLSLDDLRIYKRALSQAEILSLAIV